MGTIQRQNGTNGAENHGLYRLRSKNFSLAEYVRTRLSAATAGVNGTSGLTADPTVRAGVAGSAADLGPESVADNEAESAATVGEAGGASAPVRADRG